MTEFFDEDYYENGILTGKSCYENYRWIPELTYPLAHAICDNLNLKMGTKVLDYGCAHGFLVRALRDFKIDAFGVDISSFAISKTPTEIQGYTRQIKTDLTNTIAEADWGNFDWIISKDVFEHIPETPLSRIIYECSEITTDLLVVVPLGENGKYRIPAYEDDPSHVIRENEDWWVKMLEDNGFDVTLACCDMQGIKDRWFKAHKSGNGFFVAKSKKVKS